MAFWQKEYESLVEALLELDKPIGGVADFLAAPNAERIILRHDVDRLPQRACALARLEQRLGVRSTYYFRASASGDFPSAAIRMIAQLGHEIGYHYEDLSFCKGDRDVAIARFLRNLKTLRTVASCSTVSMHGAPLSKYHNQDLLHAEDLQRATLLGDAVTSIEPYTPYYLTDTGGHWLATVTNLRDRVGQAWPRHALPVDLPAFKQFAAEAQHPVYISTHPERWSHNLPSYLRAQAMDTLTNSIKRILKRARQVARP
ncbi:hypothetical protein HU751_005860 [Pseudomonas sp. BW13M1]|uniref:Polysaccharide deacetylase n=1 Tax=Pseudomonas peradeniyensis TaxID=2745488 RepID=A0A923K046_9PSED|nr:hypothetical protein [Pseudomonas peradeniyensis]MBV4504367.1 hypothetical protein [Pseudomonas peradeniyensis]